MYCFFMLTMLMAAPVVSSYSLVVDPQVQFNRSVENQQAEVQESPEPTGFFGFLLIHVMIYTSDDGLRPYEGANISAKGLFYSYKGQTDENGTCLFQVHTPFFRAKRYFVKVTIEPEDWLHKRFASIYVEPWEVIYREFLFIEL